ncbi:phosphonate metabolism transcriptional regulator PhnF [Paracoccus aminophilus]|uniref:Transcriptional regulator, GntR family n=1 Tax=Paracoccus aminophilus JCM 7686 TaxID=1367847 RepID=S5YEB7_PARAH|nr:phosphonate metabolism transcriptional regulator PhnF [Paracoccus aminophilus]AGT09838.1 transcriptional regulator, GntR family [Paracoccus aminophilus JCM 7686]
MTETRIAIWESIRDAVRRDISEGSLQPGDQLPTEAELSARFGVNRHTVRRALADLAEAGLVRARRGAGVFVAMQPVEYPLGRRVRFHKNLALAGRLPGRRLDFVRLQAASRIEAEALEIAPGAPVYVSEGISTADEHPIAAFRAVFPAERLPGFDELLRRLSSVTEALRESGISDYTRAETRIDAEPATPVQAGRLHLREGALLMVTRGVNRDVAGVPVEYGTTWFVAERVSLVMRPETGGSLVP